MCEFVKVVINQSILAPLKVLAFMTSKGCFMGMFLQEVEVLLRCCCISCDKNVVFITRKRAHNKSFNEVIMTNKNNNDYSRKGKPVVNPFT